MPRKGAEIIDVECTLKTATDKAWLVVPDGSEREIWVPKSKAEIDPDDEKPGSSVTITIAPGFAQHIGLT
jgi:hypothetical protein